MVAIESLDKDLVLIIIASTINSSVKELKDLTSQSTIELSLDAFLTKINELIVNYTEAFNLTPIETKVDRPTLSTLIKERKFADFVEISGDILKIETNAKAFQAILSNIAVTSTLSYAKLLIKNIDDLGIIYRSSLDEASAADSKEGKNDNAVQDTTSTEKYTIEEQVGSGEAQGDIETNEGTTQQVEAKKVEGNDKESEDIQEEDKIGLDVEPEHNHNKKIVDTEEHENNELNKEQTENIVLGKQGDEEKEQAENEDENPDKPEEKQEEKEEKEKEGEKGKEDEEENGGEEGEEEVDEEERGGVKEAEEQEEQEEQEVQKQEVEDQEGQEDQEDQSEGEQKLEQNLEEKQDQQKDKDVKKAKVEQGNATPIDSKNNVQTPEPKSDVSTKEELRSQSSRKRSRSLSVSTPQQHKRFQHIAVNLINNIQAHRFSSPFLQPVNTKEAPDYHEVIYEPKDLKNILKSIKLKNDPPEYQLIKQLKRDIMLMLANCIMYNKSDTDLVQLTKSMKNDVNNIFKLFEEAELDTK